MLATAVALHDVDDVEGFVVSTLNKSSIQFPPDELEELTAEGITLMYELADGFEPRRDGHAQDGRFSGYAAAYLPKRLTDAWHRRNRHHYQAVGEDGKRRWEYGPAPVSADDTNLTDQAAADDGAAELRMSVDAALRHAYHEWAQRAQAFAVLGISGMTRPEIARTLELSGDDQRVVLGLLRTSAAHLLGASGVA